MKRTVQLYAPGDIGTAGTLIVDINTKDQISAIDFTWDCTNVTVSVMLASVLECISKIELVDGSEVLASVHAGDLYGIDYWANGKLPYTYGGMAVGAHFGFAVRLNFGWYLWDEEFAFRPELYKNPQLKITWDEDACNTGVIVNEFSASMHLDTQPGGGGAKGMIVTREIVSNLMAASSHSYVDLPTDRRLIGMYLRGDSVDHDTPDLFNTLKLDLNSGAVVIFEQTIANYVRACCCGDLLAFPMCGDNVVTAKTLYSVFSFLNRVTIEYDATAHVTAQTLFALATYDTGQLIELTASVDIQCDFMHVHGYLPGRIIPVPFGDLMKPGTWLAMNQSDSLRADILSSAAADAGDTEALVVRQELVY